MDGAGLARLSDGEAPDMIIIWCLQGLPAVEGSALAAAAEQLSALCGAAGEFGILEPPSGWEALEAAVRAIAAGQAPLAPEVSGAGETTWLRRRPHSRVLLHRKCCCFLWGCACSLSLIGRRVCCGLLVRC